MHGLREGFGIDVPQPFPRFDFEHAIETYGSDKPDLRFAMPLVDCTALAGHSAFQVFAGAVERGGIVKGLCAKGAADRFSRKGIDELTAFVSGLGAKGLAWAKVTAGGLEGSIARSVTPSNGPSMVSGNPTFAACQVTAPSVLRRTPPLPAA